MKKNKTKSFLYEFYKKFFKIQTKTVKKISEVIIDQSLISKTSKENKTSDIYLESAKSRKRKIGLGLALGLLSLFNSSSASAHALSKKIALPTKSSSVKKQLSELRKKTVEFNNKMAQKVLASVNLLESKSEKQISQQMEGISQEIQQSTEKLFTIHQTSPTDQFDNTQQINHNSSIILEDMSNSVLLKESPEEFKSIDEIKSFPYLNPLTLDTSVEHTVENPLEIHNMDTLSPTTSNILESVFEDKKNLYIKDLEPNTENAVPITSYRPDLKTQHLDMLKELKAKLKETKEIKLDNEKKNIQDLNQISAQLEHTPTGAYFKHSYGEKKDTEEALSKTVEIMLSKILKDEKNVNKIVHDPLLDSLKTDFKGMQKEVTDLCRDVLINSTAYGEDYYTFYHGHNNDLRLYIDLLREIKSYEVIQNLDDTNPLRDKSLASKDNTVAEILDQYEEKALDYAARNGTNLYDLKRGMGVGFAPDKIEFFRDNVISTNINLFGNMNTLAECTLFYWLDSFNISNPNEALIKNIFKRLMPNASDDMLTARIIKYTNLYNELMKETGGNLMQIHVHKSIVDEISFASWMKGIPVLLDKDSETLATRGSNNRPVPVLTDKEEKYLRPSASSYIDLYTENPADFISKYSDFSSKDKVRAKELEDTYDRPQMRLIVNPQYFTNPDLVKVTQFTRFKASEEAIEKYQQSLKNLIKEDISIFLEDFQKGHTEGQLGNPLTKLNQYIKEGTEFIEQNEGKRGMKKTTNDLEDY